MPNTNIKLAAITGSDLSGQAITQQSGGTTTNCTATTGQTCNFPIIAYGWNVISLLFVLAIWAFFIATLIGGVTYLFSMGGEEGTGRAKKTFINSVIGLLLVFGSYNILNFIIQEVGPSLQQNSLSIGALVGRTYEILTVLSGAGFILLLLYGGVQYLLSAGNDEGAARAKKTITTAIIGIVMVAFAYTIARMILTILGIK